MNWSHFVVVCYRDYRRYCWQGYCQCHVSLVLGSVNCRRWQSWRCWKPEISPRANIVNGSPYSIYVCNISNWRCRLINSLSPVSSMQSWASNISSLTIHLWKEEKYKLKLRLMFLKVISTLQQNLQRKSVQRWGINWKGNEKSVIRIQGKAQETFFFVVKIVFKFNRTRKTSISELFALFS